ncbi:hypothetical protein HanPSC8_Chr16g0707981 [Helianthus annuus]|nr:hypothetical protein HanPSC8_Chr16g0707981 [Helianthus annuus]
MMVLVQNGQIWFKLWLGFGSNIVRVNTRSKPVRVGQDSQQRPTVQFGSAGSRQIMKRFS